MKYLILAFALVWSQCSIAQVLIHAHNDYAQANPIVEALQNDCYSLEVDVALYDNELVISHDDKKLSKKKSFSKYYLKPLIDELKDYDKSIVLLVDIKEYSDKLLEVLHQDLLLYDRHIIRRQRPTKRGLQIVLSGDIPRKQIIEQGKYFYFFIDGRLENLAHEYANHNMPWISMDIKKTCAWKGHQRPKSDDIKKLRAVIKKVHQHNKKIRLWNTPDNQLMWNTLIALGVDIINTDQPKIIRMYCLDHGL